MSLRFSCLRTRSARLFDVATSWKLRLGVVLPLFWLRKELPGLRIARQYVTRARLRQLYGNAAGLWIKSSREQGTVVTVTVPYHLTEVTQTVQEKQQIARTGRR